MRSKLSDWPCSVARSLELVGDAWTALLLRDAFHGLRRFDDFHKSLGIARNTLSDRLNKLVDGGLLTKRAYQDNPPRNEYLLTDKGKDFFPVLAALLAWGDRWLDDGNGAPVTLHHETHGHDVNIATVCLTCGEVLSSEDIEFRVGPGYPGQVDPARDIRSRLAPAPPAEASRPAGAIAP